MAKARRLALLAFAALLAGCGGSSVPKPPHGGAVLRLTIPTDPATLDPAKVADLPSLNVVHELNAGLTRFSGSGVEPDLAESWEPSENGLVWTFHLRKGIRWSNGVPITAEDFRRSWLRALAPATHSAYARAEMQNIRGARRFRVTGSGEVGIEAVDDCTLRVTLQHPVPWLDEQVAWPVFFPVPSSGKATSGPFRLASRTMGRLVLGRSSNYWNVAAVKPRRVVLTSSATGADGVLPRGLAAPGFPWVATARAAPPGSRTLPALSVELLWLVTRRPPLDQLNRRKFLGYLVEHSDPDLPFGALIPRAMPGASTIDSGLWYRYLESRGGPLRLTLAYTEQDAYATELAEGMRRSLRDYDVELTLRPVATLGQLLGLAGPPTQPGVDLVLLGWSSEFFDAYNILDLFPCGSAFNVAQWCDHSFDRLMARAVRTLDDQARWRIERELILRLQKAAPVVPLYSPSEHVYLKPGVRGFRWSPIGFYELMGMTRS